MLSNLLDKWSMGGDSTGRTATGVKVSMKSDYGVRAVLDLASHFGKGPIQSSEIAARQRIPEPYLDQLLTTLRKAGLIVSKRGPQGGHCLARPPEQITMGHVIDALEGRTAPIDCLEDMVRCQLSDNCGQREVWRQIAELTQHVLDTTTIQDLLDRQNQRQEQMMYHI